MSKPRKQYEPVSRGRLRCATCRKRRSYRLFTVHRVRHTGRTAACKPCRAATAVSRRRATGKVVYAPASGRRIAGAPYVKRACSVCQKDFEPIRIKQEKCSACYQLFRAVFGRLTAERKYGRPKVSVATANVVLRRFYRTTSCCYCGRAFSPKLKKSLDHKIPLCCGSDPDDVENIAICCIDCNRSKAWLKVSDWLNLCRLIVAHQQQGDGQ